MSSDEEYNIAARYRTVRKRLDSLGYQQALSLDALPLIERLLADLIQTTESLKHFKTVAQENIEACTQLQLIIDPYKCDNARLVQECNQLNLDLIETEEAYQKQIKDLKKQVYKLECECNDLQLTSSRNLQKIKDLETESAKKSKKILDLQGKCLKPIISNIGIGNKKRPCYPLRRPVIEAEPLPKTGSSNSTLPSTHAVEPKILDLLSMADHRMSCLSHEVTKLKGELSLQTDNVYTLQNQLTTKEKEIIRLKKLLEGGRPYSAVAKDCLCKKVNKMHVASHDTDENNDLKILLQSKQELEQQLKETVNKQHEAMSQAMKLAERNEELEKELRDIDHIALSVEADCNSAVKENNRRVYRLQEKLEDVMEQVHALENELAVKRKEVQELTADLEACKLEKRNIQRTLESTLEEKKKITNKINQLTIIEKSLNDEIERLSKENECQKQDIIQLQYTNKVLKEQLDTEVACRDDLKQLREKGEKNDQNRGKKSMGNRTDTEDRECSSSLQEINIDREEYKSIYREGEVNKLINHDRTSDNMRKLIIEKDLQIDNLQQSIQQLENERDYYKNECNSLKQKDESSNKDNVELWTRTYELKCQLNEKEKIIFELQKEKNDLYHDRKELEAYKTRQKKSCTPSGSCKIYKPVSTCAHLSSTLPHDIHTETTKVMLDSLERERDTARADVQRLIEERDVLYERLKGTQRGTVNGYEDQLEDLQEELRRTKQELTAQRTQFFQLRALQDQTDQALGDVQGQLTQSETELNKAIDRNKNMEQQHLQLDDQVKELKQEINNLHTNMAHLDREKDQLLMVLDEKTEKIVALERELIHKEQQANSMEHQIRDLQHKNEICVDQSAEYERQFRSLQLEVKNVQRQLETSNTDRENAIQENRRLQDDLAAVMCEVRNLQHELESSRAESYDLKRQLQTYVSEVRRAEEMLNRKENERTEMLNHFRSLSLEATVLENNNHSLESEAAEARGALQTARDRLIDLERQLVDKDCLIRGYETQISELTQNVASMETQLRQQTEQRQRAEADLSAVRDLCIKMDQQKDSLMQQLEDKDVTKTQYETQLVRLRTEQNVIQDQMDRDRATIERLETLLDQARQDSIKVQTTNQELQNEMSRLKQKISELQTTLSAESLELRQYQNQAAEYSKQISELRRQVTNERFDRARKEEENRRYLNQEKIKGNSDILCKTCALEAVSPGISNKECMKSDHGNEFTAIKIQVGFSEKILANDTVPIAASTPNTYMKKSYSISCCLNTPPQDTVHSQTVITELSDQKCMPSQLSKHSLSKLCDNDHNSYITSYRYAGNQYMEIHNNQSIISDTSNCQCLNELEMPERILSCTVANDPNCNMEKSTNSTVNIHDKANKDTINDTIQNIYVRNITKRLGDSDNDNSTLYQTKKRSSTINGCCKQHSKLNFCIDSKIISSGIENVSNKEIKQINLCKQNEYERVWKNKNYTYLSDTIMKSVEKNVDNVSCQKEKNIEFDDYISTNTETCNDLQNNDIQSSSSDTIVIAFSKPKFKQVLSEIKEHTKSLEKQIKSINNIIENITVLSEQKAHLSSEKENFTIFYEKRYTYSNESQTDEFVDINNNKGKIIEKNMEGFNVRKYIKKCALSTSSLTEKLSICQEPIATSTNEKLLENDDTVNHCMREQCSMFKQQISYVEEKNDFPTTAIIAHIANHKPDQINIKSAPHTNHKIDQVPLCHSYDKNTSKFKTDQMKLSIESKTKNNYCDQTDCNTAIPYHSIMKTTVSNHDTIYGLYLETTYTQSSNFQIVAATSVSSLKLNSNTTESNDFTKSEKSTFPRNLTEKNNNKVSPDTLDISTMVNDLNPSISIQCININLSNCHDDPRTTKLKDTSVRNIHEKVTKSKKNKKFKLRKN